MKTKIISLLFFLLGAFSLLTQTILIREYFVSFQGNEIAIGIFYATWFLWIALGASLIITRKQLAQHFLKYLAIYPLCSLIEIWLFSSLKGIAHIEAWEFFPLEKALPLTFILNIPISFFTGIIFTSGCRFLKITQEENSQIVSRAYIYESLGSFFIGMGITIILIKLIELLPVLIFTSLIFLIILLFAAYIFRDKTAVFLTFLFLSFYILIFISRNYIFKQFSSLRWKYILPQAELLDEISTPYQHLSIARLKSQLILLSNGKIIETLPDKVSGYQMSALFISMLNLPEDILVFGYGSENTLRYLLNFPVKSITYVTPDKNYFYFLSEYLPPELKPLLKDKRLKISFQDPKSYLLKSKKKYDLIIINSPDPSTAFLNKYFTAEFYILARKHLKEKGALATKITSAENFIGTEIRNYGSSILYTLNSVFKKIVIVPGEINWFFAGRKKSIITQNPQILTSRYKKYMPPDSTFSPQGFSSLLPENRIRFLKEVYFNNPLFKNEHLINSERKPLSYFLNLLVLARYTNSNLVKILKAFFFSGWFPFLLPIIIFLIFRIHYLLFIENEERKRLIFNAKFFQFFSGVSAFTYHLILMFLFQNRFGTLFQLIALVNSLFMLGLFSGSVIGKKLILRFNSLKLIFSIIITQILLYFLSYPFLEKFLPLIPSSISFSVYILLFFTAGTLAGCSYPLAGKLLESSGVKLLNLAGSLEILDHCGAGLGALLTGIILIPLLGIYRTLILLGILSGLILIFICLEIFKIATKEKTFSPQKLSSPYIKNSYILFAVSLWAIFTFNHIERQKEKFSEKSLPPILSQTLLNFEITEFKNKPLPHYLGYKNNNTYYIFYSRDLGTSTKGFGGEVDVTVIADSNQVIKKIIISGPQESPPQLEMVKSWAKKLEGKKLNYSSKIKENIDAVTGATITSNAVITTLRKTYNLITEKFFNKKPTVKKEIKFTGTLPAIVFILFILTGLLLFYFNRSKVIRTVYLISLIFILGFKFNLQLSSIHIFNILCFNFPSVINLSLLLLVSLPLILGILYGRFYCGWLCPFGALQETIGNTKLERNIPEHLERKASYIKYILLAVLVVLVAVTRNINLFSQDPLTGVFIFFNTSPFEKIFLFIVLFFSFFFPRFWCRYFCIVGALLSLFNKIAFLKHIPKRNLLHCGFNVKNSRDLNCIQCNKCLSDEKQ